ncbi:MAG: hypothetical protein ACXWC9_06590, partial [Pseudobdellovibrionaceae bacterium]
SDIQDVQVNASKIMEHGEWLIFEMGNNNYTAAGTATPRAEGGFARSMGDSKYGFYLGAHPSWVDDVRLNNTGTYLTNENPVSLFYGSKASDLAWGVGLMYSNSDKKTTTQKQSATGLNAGVTGSNWDAGLTLGLMNTYKNDTATVDFKGTTAIDLAATYTMETMTFSAGIAMNGGKEELNAVETHKRENVSYNVGVVNSHKSEGSDFFYGAKLVSTVNKDKTPDNKTETMSMPVFAGIEADATSWMVLRASVQQNFLLGSTKTTTAGVGGDADTIANNTSVAAGAGLKFGKLLLDGTLEAANSNTAALNGNAMLANAAVTYMF